MLRLHKFFDIITYILRFIKMYLIKAKFVFKKDVLCLLILGCFAGLSRLFLA